MINPEQILNKYYGYKTFRKDQEDIINRIINKNNVLAIMPTGAGKSICYQIPALIFEGITIVISPLISLMKDQVDNLNEMGIKSAFINSTLDNNEINAVMYEIKNGNIKLLYVAPERLDNINFLNMISNIKVSQIAIDEAHCVSQWGHDFRTSYRKIPGFIDRLINKPVITAFTATASKEVREDIINLLRIENPKIFVSGFDRSNLTINVVKGANKNEYVKEYLRKNKDLCGIIYCATRKQVDSLYELLVKKGYEVGKYHGGMNETERINNQEDFIKDKIRIIIATNAFGMGIDKPDVRYVIHYNMPQNIEGYYQEIGRAGRDGEKSECILLFSPSDVHTQKFLVENSIVNPDRKNIGYKKIQEMLGFIYTNDCYRKYILNYFGEEAKDTCDNCSNCLTEGELVDKTIDTQKVVSCIYRMKRNYGINMLVDVLRGSKNSKVIKLGFDKLSTYGIMKDYRKEDLSSFINTLISHGYIDQLEGEYPVIALNNTSIDVIKGKVKVILKQINIKKSDYELNELFEKLRALRFEIAKEHKVPAYAVFSDTTLKEMSNKYPETTEELLDINGIGEVKAKKYGEQFINVIKEYINKNNIVKEKKDINLEEEKYINYESDEKLYDELKKIRKVMAERENKYPYYIISRRSLLEISARYPITLDELSDISGIGPVKVKNYGQEIIDLVSEYCTKNSIERNWQNKGKRKIIIDNEKRTDFEIAMELISQNVDIKDISTKYEISVSTILGYLTDYVKETGENKFNINLDSYYTKQEEEEIFKACDEYGTENLSIIKKNVDKSIQYEKIRAVILKKYYNVS